MSPWNLGDWSLSSLFRGDNGITQTVNAIRSAVYYSVRRPEIRQRAEYLIFGCAERDEYCEVTRIKKWVDSHFRYVRDPIGLELVKSPEVSDAEISKQDKFQGDCDDVTAYIAALLKSIGYPVRVVVMGVPGKGEEFRHIYPKVYLPKRRAWLALEMTAKQHPVGWSAKASRIREYDI
jgi:transglutaminase-like putative cysteine protease